MKHTMLDAARDGRFGVADWFYMPSVSRLSISPCGKYIAEEYSRFVLEGDEAPSLTVIRSLEGEELLRIKETGGFWHDGGYCIPSENALTKYTPDGEKTVIAVPGKSSFCHVPFKNGFLTICDEPIEADGYIGNTDTFMDVCEYPWKRDGHGFCGRTRASLMFMEPAGEEKAAYRLLSFRDSHVCHGLNGFGSAPMTTCDRYIHYWADTFKVMPAARAAAYCLDWQTGENRVIAEAGEFMIESGALLGDTPYYIATDMNEEEMRYMNSVIIRPENGEFKVMLRPEEGMINAICPMKNGFLVTMALHGNGGLFYWEPGRDLETIYAGEYDITCAAATKEGRIFAAARKADTVQEVCEVTDHGLRFLTDHTAAFCRFDINITEKITVPGGEGCTVEGWVLKPRGYEAGRKYPGVLMIHGGPEGWYNANPTREMFTLASEGYFVFYCNPRGSGSYSRKHLIVDGHYGTYDFDNIMDFTDAVLEAYPDIDASRLGVTGGSYGGFMTNWIIGHTERFAAAVSCRSISDWTTMSGTTDIPWFPRLAQRGDPWTNRGALWDRSPLKYADRVKTPTLFLQNKADFRCPSEQAYIMFSALLHHNVKARLVMNNDASHSKETPAQREHDMHEMLCWFEEHMPSKAE